MSVHPCLEGQLYVPWNADLLVLFGDGVLDIDAAPLALGVGGLSLGVIPIPPPLLLVTLMFRSIVDGC